MTGCRRANGRRSFARYFLRETTRGQAAVETALFFSVVVGVLVVMSIYLFRSYQGYLNANASSHGLQFDPRRRHDVTEDLIFSQVQDIDIEQGRAAIRTFGGQGGPLAGSVGRVRGTQAKVTTNWDLTRDATYRAD